MNCYSCNLFDMNDTFYAFGTCEPQDIDFHCTHICNLTDNERNEIYNFIYNNKNKGVIL